MPRNLNGNPKMFHAYIQREKKINLLVDLFKVDNTVVSDPVEKSDSLV